MAGWTTQAQRRSSTSPASNLRQRIVSAIGGKDIAKNLLEVGAEIFDRQDRRIRRPSFGRQKNEPGAVPVRQRPLFQFALFPQGDPAGLRN